MTAQIRPNRMEVSDRFPMLGFAVRTDQPDVEAEVVIASDIGLFNAQNRQSRSAANFYSSREHGTLTVPRGEGVFVVPPEVLARFIGNDKIFFGLATGRSGNGGLNVDALPREGSPYVSLRGFTGRTLRRGFGGARATAPKLDWTGDAPKPGSEAANGSFGAPPPVTNGNGASAPVAGSYDDGFGPMPAIPARESSYRGGRNASRTANFRGVPFTAAFELGLPRGTTAITMSSGTTPREALDWIMHKVEQVVDLVGDDVTPPILHRLGSDSGAFVSAWETILGAIGWLGGGATAFLAKVPELARTTGVTISVGPALDTPVFGGGVGVVFDPNGDVALFGQGDFSTDLEGITEFVKSLKVQLQAKMKLGYNRDGIAMFARLSKVGGVSAGAEIVVGAEIWLNDDGEGIGGAVSVGVGMALQLAAQEAAGAVVMPTLPGDQRERAKRIGGEFAPRIGQALDLGYDPAALAPLLDKLDPPAAATPLGMARGLGATQWSINWDDVDSIPQPTDNGCWATTLAMLIGWRDQVSIAPHTIAGQCGRDIANGLPWAERATAAAALGLGTVPPQCYLPEGFASLLENHGPLYVGKMASGASLSGHAVLVVGMYSDGTDHFLRVVDPWDRAVGTPGAPGPHGAGHATGSRYIMKYEEFQNEYEMAAAGNPAFVQILYAGIPEGRSINRSTSAPAGFAMAAVARARELKSPPPFKSRSLDAVAIAGIAIDVISNSSGDIKTNLANWNGVKHPNDVAPDPQAAFQPGEVQLRDWPLVGGTFGIDDIYCWLKIRWQYNGTSLGRIYIDDDGHDDAAGWGLTVTTTIEDDSRLYARSSQARLPGPDHVPALHINITYTFDEVMADDQVANTRVSLFADGTHEVTSRWVQHSRPGGGNPTHVARPFEHA